MRTRFGCTYASTSPRCVSNMTSHSARILRDRNSDEQTGRREPWDVAANIARQIPCFAISGTDMTLGGIFESHPRELLKVHQCCTNIAKRGVSHRYFIASYRKPISSRPNSVIKNIKSLFILIINKYLLPFCEIVSVINNYILKKCIMRCFLDDSIKSLLPFSLCIHLRVFDVRWLIADS